MTNAEKYLKENVNIDEFVSNFLHECNCPREDLELFLNDEVKQTLSEDEKVILKNIGPRYIRIARTSINKDLYVTNNDKTIQHFLFAFNHLFQSIKPGEEYKISDLLEE